MNIARALLRAVDHRPWPMPSGPWIMVQRWENLLFAHWPVPYAVLRPLVPPQLELDTCDEQAWVGLVPFRITDLRFRLLPPIPFVSAFPEMNLRTYVRVGDRPGIYFFTLEAASRAAVVAARRVYRLPYHHAQMQVEESFDWIHYRSRRESGAAELVARYRPAGDVFHARPGTLEYFLTERYALYVVLRSARILCGEIHHPPWTLRAARAEVDRNTVAAAHGVALPETAPVLHFAARQDTLIWPPRLAS